jgi:hypothetical protein
MDSSFILRMHMDFLYQLLSKDKCGGCWWNDVLQSKPTAAFRVQPQTLSDRLLNLTRGLGVKEVVTDSPTYGTAGPQWLIIFDFKFDYAQSPRDCLPF